MPSFDQIFAYVRIILFAIIFLIAIVYAIPVICMPRFHHSNAILTLNICLATAFCSLYWLMFYIMLMLNTRETYRFMIRSCLFVSIVPTMLTLQVPFSFITATINRFCYVVYFNKLLFKKKRWVFICITSQWVFGTLVTLPILIGLQPSCSFARWVDTYKLILIVIFPAIAFLVINMMIYVSVRSSSQRIQPSLSTAANHSNDDQPSKISRRDLHLLRHMILMFAIFVGGWAPLYVLLAIQNQFSINPVLLVSLTIWCELAWICDIADLYLYNHEFRKLLKMTLLRCIK